MSGRRLRSVRGAPITGALVTTAWPLVCACNPTLFIGADQTPDAGQPADVGQPPDAGQPSDAVQAPDVDQTSDADNAPIDFPWSTSFENGDADFAPPQGFCYAANGASLAIVDAPVRSGAHSAAFTVVAEGGIGEIFPPQVRCVRQGILPQQAYYGAWYYVPKSVVVPTATPQNLSLWNLFHFQGADAPGGENQNLWDLSLYSTPDGALHVYGFDFLRAQTVDASAVGTIPLGDWVHFEVFLKRSDSDAGEFAIYQNGVLAADVTGVATDTTNWGQFFVGSLASALLPPNVTVYVDDVSITPAL